MNQRNVAVVSTGGTISSKRTASGATPQLTAEELVAEIPEISSIAEVVTSTPITVASKEITFEGIFRLRDEITRLIQTGVDGVVVLQGTDSVEEVAFAIDLLTSTETPIVFTAAMRNPDMLSPDGPANLTDAVRVAAADSARGAGVLLVMNNEVHSARFVKKTHTSNLAAFSSKPYGPIGAVYEGNVYVALTPRSFRRLSASGGTLPGNVGLVVSVIDDNGAWLTQAAHSLDGLVLEGSGGGHLSAACTEALTPLLERIPIVITSRTGAGPVLQNTYGTVGGDIDLKHRGFLAAGHLDGPKARTLLALTLTLGDEAIDEFKRIVEEL